jgi:hypothetical protein
MDSYQRRDMIIAGEYGRSILTANHYSSYFPSVPTDTRHAIFFSRGGRGLWVTHVGSRNGSPRNSEKLERCLVFPN